MEPVQNEIEPIIQQNLDHNARELRAHDIGHPPTNPADRRRLVLLTKPNDKEFSDPFAAKVIGHNCMDGWLGPAILWKEAPQLFRDRAWEDFTKRFVWDPSIDSKIKEMYLAKCLLRTKGNMNKARTRAMKEAEKLHPGQGEDFMHLFHPWFTDAENWALMCQKWREPDFKKRSQVAKANRVAGQPSGLPAKGTYRGGTKSQVHYMMEQESQSQTEGAGETPKDFAEMYVSLRSDFPGVAQQAEEYQRLMHEKYPDATSTLPFDEEVWTKATGQKKGWVKGIGQKRTRPSSFSQCTSVCSAAGHSTATSAAPSTELQAQDIIQAICHNPSLMEQLRSTFLACFGQNGVQAAQGQSSQASGNNGPEQPPPPPQ
ncbi:hypothetical protein ACHQM5_004460 [Ranunculus cassubicifolius]